MSFRRPVKKSIKSLISPCLISIPSIFNLFRSTPICSPFASTSLWILRKKRARDSRYDIRRWKLRERSTSETLKSLSKGERMLWAILSPLLETRISVFERNEQKSCREIRDDVAASKITGLKFLGLVNAAGSHWLPQCHVLLASAIG